MNNQQEWDDIKDLVKDIKKKRKETKRKRDGLFKIQPLSAPTGMLFYLDYKYTNPKFEKRKRIIGKLLKDVE